MVLTFRAALPPLGLVAITVPVYRKRTTTGQNSRRNGQHLAAQLPDGVDVDEWMRSLKRHERLVLMRSLRDKQAKNSSDEMQSWTQSRKQQRPLPDNHELLAKEWRESA